MQIDDWIVGALVFFAFLLLLMLLLIDFVMREQKVVNRETPQIYSRECK